MRIQRSDADRLPGHYSLDETDVLFVYGFAFACLGFLFISLGLSLQP